MASNRKALGGARDWCQDEKMTGARRRQEKGATGKKSALIITEGRGDSTAQPTEGEMRGPLRNGGLENPYDLPPSYRREPAMIPMTRAYGTRIRNHVLFELNTPEKDGRC